MTDDDALIRLRVDPPSATVILNRRDRLNAISPPMVERLIEMLEDLQQEQRVRAIILTGAGDYFSSGTDLKAMAEAMRSRDQHGLLDMSVMHDFQAEVRAMQQLLEVVLRMPKPMIAAVNGPALGFGSALVLASDIALAGPRAGLGWPETQWGLAPGLSAPLLRRRLNSGQANALLCFGTSVDAPAGHQMGLFDRIVEEHLLWAAAHQMACDLVNLRPHSIAMTKRLMCETIEESLFNQLAVGAANTAAARTTLEAIDGVAGFAARTAEPSRAVDPASDSI